MTTKPTVLVDMDGPLADFDALFFARCELNGWLLDCTLERQRHRFATDHVLDADHRRRARQMVDATHFFRDLPPVDGAISGINELTDHADVWIVTKPLEANTACASDKVGWVRQYLGADWLPRLIIAPDKSMVRGDILLDDAPHLHWLDTATWVAVVYPMTWNQHAESKWVHLPTWTWGRPVGELLAHVGACR